MKRIIFILSLVISSGAIAGSLWLTVGSGFNQLVDEAFLSPNEERRLSQYDVIEIEPDAVVFLGDSITAGGAWQELLPQVKSYNRGIEGDTTAGVLKRLSKIVEAQPAKVFLLIGTNDLDDGYSIDEIVGNIGSIVTTIKTSSPATVVYVQSVLPRAAEYQTSVELLNAKIQAEIGTDAVWVDLYPLLLNEQDGSIVNQYSNDELHLLGVGYEVWCEALQQYL